MKRPIYALVDCNNFFVSCERVFRPDLWHKPVAVLSNNDGCIVARSNEVKALGVPMAVPYFQVKQTLDQAGVTLFSGNFRLYGDFSQRVVRVLQASCPSIEVYSVDESFLELSRLDIEDYATWAIDLRHRILRWTGIPVSIGIAPTKTLAKAAAEYAKKNEATGGVHVLLPNTTYAAQHSHLLRWLPVGDIWGIGRRTAPKLEQIGISNALQLTQTSDEWAQARLSIRGLRTVKELRGEDCLGFETRGEPQQTIARTRSFGHNVRDYYQLEAAIATFAAQAAAKLREQQEVARAVLVFLRPARQFELRSVSTVIRLLQTSSDTGAIITAALQALEQLHEPDLAYKKAGVVLFDLVPAHALQLTLLENSAAQIERQTRLMCAVDTLNQRYNARLIRHASEHSAHTDWHSKRDQRSPAYTTSWRELPVLHV